MQVVECNTDFVTPPRVYRNRPHSLAFNSPRPEPLCDVIYLIDQDPTITAEISTCFSNPGVKVATFASAAEYLALDRKDTAACLVVNTDLSDIDSFELLLRLAEKANPPVIFISDPCEIASIVRAMKAGAIEFLTKPIKLPALAASVQTAFAQDRKQRRKKAELADLRERFSLLTPREREVLPLVVGGLLNKQAASVLGISEVTLQIHRSQVMRKTRAESFADLVRMAMKLRIPHWREQESSHEEHPARTSFGFENSVVAPTQSAVR